METLKTNRAQEVVSRCRVLARITDVQEETTRTFLSPAMRLCNKQIAEWMRAAGMIVHMDAAGNLRGLRRAAVETEKTLVLASHLDTVPNAGAFDGPLGVVLPLVMVQELGDVDLPYNIEVIGFSEEEGVRFSFPFIGSKALVGELTDELLARTDHKGGSVREAIASYGLDIGELTAARIGPGHFAYLEFHIEQGPLLESEGRALGVVESVIGQSRYLLTWRGHANHAGTTPMHLRRDALTAASEFVLAVEEQARSVAGLVATVGKLVTLPGAGNIIPGEVICTLDVRHANDDARSRAVKRLLDAAKEIAEKRGVAVTELLQMDQATVPMDARLTATLAEAAGSDALRMVSGAGHDAMIMAPKVPSTMLFLRTPGGLSHHPDEEVQVEDVELALQAGMSFLHLMAREVGDDA